MAIQVVIGLGDPQPDQFSIVSLGHTCERFESRAGLRPPSRGEEPFSPRELELEAIGRNEIGSL